MLDGFLEQFLELIINKLHYKNTSKNTRLEINNEILNFYTKTTGESIKLDNKEDRVKLSITIFKSSDILTSYSDILKQLINKYYWENSLNDSYTEEFYKLIEFIFYDIINGTTYDFDETLKNELIEEITISLENARKLRIYELNNDLENSLECWKKFLGDDFDYSKSS